MAFAGSLPCADMQLEHTVDGFSLGVWLGVQELEEFGSIGGLRWPVALLDLVRS